MAGYIVRRLLQAIPVLLGTTFLIYFMVFAMPGDPIVALFGDKTPPPQVLEAVRERYNLDKPFIVQYLLFLGGIFQGDLGVSFSGEPVSDILARTFPVTLRLAVLSTLFLMVGGILVASHVVGNEMREIYDAMQAGDADRAREIDQGIRPIFEALTVTTNPIPIKAAAEMLGMIPSARMRLPMVEADDEQRAVVRRALEAHGLPVASAA